MSGGVQVVDMQAGGTPGRKGSQRLVGPRGPEATVPLRAAEIHPGLAGLARVEEDWHALLERAGDARYFDLPAWYRCYLNAFSDTCARDLCFLTARDHTGPLVVVPARLERRRIAGVRLCTLALPHSPHMPCADIVCSPETARGEMVPWLLERAAPLAGGRVDAFVFPRVLEGARALAAFEAWGPSRGVVIRRGASHEVDVQPLHEIHAKIDGRLRRDLRRARRRLDAAGGAQLVVAREGPALERAFQSFLTLEASGWKGHGGTRTAIELVPEALAFYRGLATSRVRGGSVEVNLLIHDGRTLAGQLCVRTAETLYLLKIGYDERDRALLPGFVLQERVLERLATEGARHMSFITDAAWQQGWRPRSVPIYEAVAFRRTPRGLLAYLLLAVRPLARPLLTRLRALSQQPRGGAARSGAVARAHRLQGT